MRMTWVPSSTHILIREYLEHSKIKYLITEWFFTKLMFWIMSKYWEKAIIIHQHPGPDRNKTKRIGSGQGRWTLRSGNKSKKKSNKTTTGSIRTTNKTSWPKSNNYPKERPDKSRNHQQPQAERANKAPKTRYAQRNTNHVDANRQQQ